MSKQPTKARRYIDPTLKPQVYRPGHPSTYYYYGVPPDGGFSYGMMDTKSGPVLVNKAAKYCPCSGSHCSKIKDVGSEEVFKSLKNSPYSSLMEACKNCGQNMVTSALDLKEEDTLYCPQCGSEMAEFTASLKDLINEEKEQMSAKLKKVIAQLKASNKKEDLALAEELEQSLAMEEEMEESQEEEYMEEAEEAPEEAEEAPESEEAPAADEDLGKEDLQEYMEEEAPAEEYEAGEEAPAEEQEAEAEEPQEDEEDMEYMEDEDEIAYSSPEKATAALSVFNRNGISATVYKDKNKYKVKANDHLAEEVQTPAAEVVDILDEAVAKIIVKDLNAKGKDVRVTRVESGYVVTAQDADQGETKALETDMLDSSEYDAPASTDQILENRDIESHDNGEAKDAGSASPSSEQGVEDPREDTDFVDADLTEAEMKASVEMLTAAGKDVTVARISKTGYTVTVVSENDEADQGEENPLDQEPDEEPIPEHAEVLSEGEAQEAIAALKRLGKKVQVTRVKAGFKIRAMDEEMEESEESEEEMESPADESLEEKLEEAPAEAGESLEDDAGDVMEEISNEGNEVDDQMEEAEEMEEEMEESQESMEAEAEEAPAEEPQEEMEAEEESEEVDYEALSDIDALEIEAEEDVLMVLNDSEDWKGVENPLDQDLYMEEGEEDSEEASEEMEDSEEEMEASYTVMIKNQPVAAIYLKDQPNPKEVKSMFSTEEYAINLIDAMLKVGVKKTLQDVNAKFYASEVTNKNLKEKLTASIEDKYQRDYADKVATIRADLSDRIALVLAGMNKNFFSESNHLKAALFKNMETADIANPEEVIEASFEEGAVNFFAAVMDKSMEYLDTHEEALSEIRKAIGESNIIPLEVPREVEAAEPEETMASRLAKGNFPIQAATTQADLKKSYKDLFNFNKR